MPSDTAIAIVGQAEGIASPQLTRSEMNDPRYHRVAYYQAYSPRRHDALTMASNEQPVLVPVDIRAMNRSPAVALELAEAVEI
jgi:hypothetical protein